MIKCHYSDRFFWIRIFGKGIKIKDINIYPLLPNERLVRFKGFVLFNWYIGLLPKLRKV